MVSGLAEPWRLKEYDPKQREGVSVGTVALPP